MATEATVQRGTRHGRLDEFANNYEQVIERQEQCFSQFSDHSFFSRGQRGLKDMGPMGMICHRIPLLPFSDRGSGDVVVPGKSPFREGGLLDFLSDRWGCTCSFMKIDLHMGSLCWSNLPRFAW